MPNNSGYKASVTLGGSTPTRLQRVGYTVNGAPIDIPDLSHAVAQMAPGIATVDVVAEQSYKGSSGRRFTLTLGAYAGAEFDNVTLTARNDEIDTADAADAFTQRVPGAGTFEATGGGKYNATTHFATLAKVAASTGTSLAASIHDSAGSAVISGLAFVNRGGWDAPRGAITQEFGVRFKTITSITASAKFCSMVKTASLGAASTAVVVKDPAGTTKLSGAGYAMEATFTATAAGAVTESIRHSVHTVTTLV